MATPAQIAASRANSLKSRGPKTVAGKEISRRNALEHGMAVEVVQTDANAAEVRRRHARADAAEDRDGPLPGQADRPARRLRRALRRSGLAHNAYDAAHAGESFDEARIAAVSQIRAEPAAFARQLRSTPEGVERMVAELLDLRDAVPRGLWDDYDGEKLANLTGVRFYGVPVTRVRALSEAIVGKFQFLRPEGGGDPAKDERIAWAKAKMIERIDAEVEMLLDHRETLDIGRSSATARGPPIAPGSSRPARRSWRVGTRRPSGRSTRP